MLVRAEKIAATVILGVHGRRRAGPGESFWQYRPYGFGDSAQRIDWRRSALSNKVYIRDNEWEAANTIWIWANTNARMKYKSHLGSELKLDRALVLALALGSLAARAHERVGALGSHQRARYGRGAVLKLCEYLLGGAATALPQVTSYQRAATAVLISDFLDDPKLIGAQVAGLAASGIKGHLVQIVDPAEESLPFSGRIEFLGLDQPARFLSPKTEALRADYVAAYLSHRQALRDIARSVGWTFVTHHTNEAPTKALLTLYGQISDAKMSRIKGGAL
jgi:uncharacterized protein (DUF58 family)